MAIIRTVKDLIRSLLNLKTHVPIRFQVGDSIYGIDGVVFSDRLNCYLFLAKEDEERTLNHLSWKKKDEQRGKQDDVTLP